MTLWDGGGGGGIKKMKEMRNENRLQIKFKAMSLPFTVHTGKVPIQKGIKPLIYTWGQWMDAGS